MVSLLAHKVKVVDCMVFAQGCDPFLHVKMEPTLGCMVSVLDKDQKHLAVPAFFS